MLHRAAGQAITKIVKTTEAEKTVLIHPVGKMKREIHTTLDNFTTVRTYNTNTVQANFKVGFKSSNLPIVVVVVVVVLIYI